MELSMLNVIGVMLLIAAIAGIVNEKVFKQSNTIGSMIATACFSVVLLALESMQIIDIHDMRVLRVNWVRAKPRDICKKSPTAMPRRTHKRAIIG